MKPTPVPPALAALQQIDGCSLANAIETFRVRLRNEGFTAGATRCLFPQLPPMVGHAVTIKIRGSSPPPTGATRYTEGTEWWDYVLSVPGPRILVVQDISTSRGAGAFIGEVHANILRALGCVGAVTDGAVRDLPAVERLGFPLFAARVSVSHAYEHIVGVGEPVEVDGLTIRSGDLLHGDAHGLQNVPADLLAQLPGVAASLAARERQLIALAQTPGVSVAELRAAINRNRSA